MKSFEQQTSENFRTLRTWAVVVSLALVLTIGLAAYGFATGSDAQNAASTLARHEAIVAHRVAGLADSRAKIAAGVSVYTYQRLQAEAVGECYRVNYLRWQVDRQRYADWRRDRFSARFLYRLHHRTTSALARYFAESARNEQFLPLTDCALATSSPTTYHPPLGMPFRRVSRSLLRQVFRSSPRPPGAP